MERLKEQIDRLLSAIPDEAAVRARLREMGSVHPFNEYEFILSHLLAKQRLSLDEYIALRQEYLARNLNRPLFELGPTAFGTTWAESHLLEIAPALAKAAGGAHDLVLDGEINVEAKASRAVDKKSKRPLVEKALRTDSNRPFLMNFQQTKPAHFDVIVWIGVWLDRIRYWVHSSSEIAGHRRFSGKQHRGNIGEGQLHVTDKNIDDFNGNEVQAAKLADAIRTANGRGAG